VAIVFSTNPTVLVNGTRIEIPSLGVVGNIINQTSPNVYQVSNIPPGTIGTFLNCSFGNFTTISDLNYNFLYNGNQLLSTGFTSSPFVIGNQITGTNGGNGLYQVLSGTTSGATNFTTGGNVLIVNNVDSNVLVNGSQITGTLMTGVTINSQLSGTTGGQGAYLVTPSQTPISSQFVVAGAFIQGVGRSS
jgi:hypothetical protein